MLGTLKIQSEGFDHFFCFIGKGDLFGEDISRKIPARRSNGDVRALTYCDVYFITRERMQNVLHFYQDFAFKFSESLELTYDLGASEVMYLSFYYFGAKTRFVE